MSDTINAGEIGRRLGMTIPTETLLQIGVPPLGKDKRATIWKASDFPMICERLAEYVRNRKHVSVTPPKPTKAVAASPAPAPAPAAADDDDEL